MNGKTPSIFNPALHLTRKKQTMIHKDKLQQFPSGLGLSAAHIAAYRQAIRFKRLSEGGNLLTMGVDLEAAQCDYSFTLHIGITDADTTTSGIRDFQGLLTKDDYKRIKAVSHIKSEEALVEFEAWIQSLNIEKITSEKARKAEEAKAAKEITNKKKKKGRQSVKNSAESSSSGRVPSAKSKAQEAAFPYPPAVIWNQSAQLWSDDAAKAITPQLCADTSTPSNCFLAETFNPVTANVTAGAVEPNLPFPIDFHQPEALLPSLRRAVTLEMQTRTTASHLKNQ
ncbi:hypothetical protein IMY05_C4547000100 [Salix suchowensis]|nr:hypothetical protein IMY05_C4547000100 [Salix suchowensis]